MNEKQFIDFLVDLSNQPEGEIVQSKPLDPKNEKRHAILARLDEALKPYGWTTDFTSIFNRKGVAVHILKIKGNRVQLFDGDNIRASLAQPENIGIYIEKTFFATKTPAPAAQGESRETK